MSEMRGHFIGGRLGAGRSTQAIDVLNPATGDRIGEVSAASPQDVDDAVDAAKRAFESKAWQSRSTADRGAALWELSDRILQHQDEFAELEVRDNGMPLAFARAMVVNAAGALRYYAGMIGKAPGIATDLNHGQNDVHAYTRREPVGVVAAITPWNAPFALLMAKLAPALAAGCSIICKPAEQAPLTASRLGELLHEWKMFPEGQINIVNGLGSVAGDALAHHHQVDKITFTGSTTTGRKLIAASAGNFKRVTLELGGKSPLFIFDDADLEKAIPAAAMAIFLNAGQVCLAGSRLYIQRGIYDRVIEGVAKIGGAMRVGDGMHADTQMGPLISEQQMARVLSYIESGVSEGAELIGGGGQRIGDRGYFVSPAVFAHRGESEIRIAREEIFGPVVTAMPFDGLDDVERLANDTDYGLGSGVFTRDLSTAHQVAKRIRAGNVWINCYGLLDKSMPFGGFKQSGWGRESGFEGISAFLETKSVFAML